MCWERYKRGKRVGRRTLVTGAYTPFKSHSAKRVMPSGSGARPMRAAIMADEDDEEEDVDDDDEDEEEEEDDEDEDDEDEDDVVKSVPNGGGAGCADALVCASACNC